MAGTHEAPFAPQNAHEVSRLIQSLEAHAKKATHGAKSFSCKKGSFPAPGLDGVTVDSWRFRDWDYKLDDLPTYARGLFTLARPHPEIVVRGYDKFFNTDEVAKTSWANIEENTRGPYELSVKENGCIIFLSALPNDALLICSKHSTGAGSNDGLSHAVAGERWVDRHLAAVGKTREQLARQLRRMNATAVAELCDDEFEEHVLTYDADHAGLYLHGINLNLPEFATYPGHLVHAFADAWGFRKAEYLIKEDIGAVRDFLEGVGETGAWEGKDVEGFVIRCQARDGARGAWTDWFFKYKFEEPYLMYRQWREVTRAVIAGRPAKYKKHKRITDEYILYAKRRLAKNPKLVHEFNRNHGIIAMRDGFLQEKGLRGADVIRQEDEESGDEALEVTGDVVLVPVATIGCGKTTVAVALHHLFGWGHVQNDNIVGSNRPRRFAEQVREALQVSPAVVADRNNSEKREREQIIHDVRLRLPDPRLVALHYVHEQAGEGRQRYYDQIRKVTRDRVLSRGDNHQTIHAGSEAPEKVVGIMEGFLHRFQPVTPHNHPDDGFDAIIDLDVLASSRQNLETVVRQLHALYPKLIVDMPSSASLDRALEAALQEYRPDVKHALASPRDKKRQLPNRGAAPPREPKRKDGKVDFFCVQLPTMAVLNTLETLFDGQPADVSRFYRVLQQGRRIQASFHVTLVHRANSTAFPDAWRKFTQLYTETLASEAAGRPAGSMPIDPSLGECRVQLERVVWDERLMCIVARLLDADEKRFHTTNAMAHVTIGTASPDIKPKESNKLLAAWLERGSGEDSGIGELPLDKTVILDGSVRAIMQQRG